jgi:hypothetical protein
VIFVRHVLTAQGQRIGPGVGEVLGEVLSIKELIMDRGVPSAAHYTVLSEGLQATQYFKKSGLREVVH